MILNKVEGTLIVSSTLSFDSKTSPFMKILTQLSFSFLFYFVLLHSSSAQVEEAYLKYLGQREALLKLDSLHYFDAEIELSENEQLLNAKLLKLQKEMLQDYKDQHFFPPARNFYASKNHIEETPLFKLIQKMPKGGILHVHTPAMGSADWLLKRAIETPAMHVYWNDPEEQYLKGEFRAFKPGTAPKGFVQVAKEYQADADFYYDLRSLITFDKWIDQDSVDIWKEFQAVFQRIEGLVSYRTITADYITHSLILLARDNIQHAELRMSFRNSMYDENTSGGDIKEFVEMIEQVKANIRQVDPNFTLTIIHTNLRFRSLNTIWKDMEKVYEHRKTYPDLLKGYDLVAEEDNGHSTLFHAKAFLRLDSLAAADGRSFPLYLHDGESDWMSVDNLYDAVLLGTKRIGHGFNLFRFPILMDMVREKGICMEINPLSNQILGYVRDLRIHPASTYLRRGIDCTISSDDPLIFDYKGLSYDYWSIFMAWELDLAALKKLSRNSLTHSSLSPEEKAKALQVWETRWNTFVGVATEMLE